MDSYTHKLLLALVLVLLLSVAIIAIYLGSLMFKTEFVKLSTPGKKVDFVSVAFASFFFIGGLGAFAWSVINLTNKLRMKITRTTF